MKNTTRNTRGLGAWVLGGMASLAMVASAFGQAAVTQSTPITINDNAPATPSPSVIDLTKSNLLGSVEKVSVTLNNLAHSYANDVGVLLVYTNGATTKTVVLMNNAGGGQPVNGTLTFDANASAQLPQFSAISSGTYKPSNYGGSASFLDPNAPAAPYGSLADFVGINPTNGAWKLYVQDDSPLNAGSIASWTLNLWTTPSLVAATNKVRIAENGSATLDLTVGSSSTNANSLTVFATSGDSSIVTNGNLVVTGSGSSRTLTITPNLNGYGTNSLTIVATDGVGGITNTVSLEVFHVNQAPTISLTTNKVNSVNLTTTAGVMTSSVLVNVDDVDIPAFESTSSLTLSASSSNPSVVNPASGVFFNGTGKTRSFTVVPVGAATGTATLTIFVSDGSLSNSVTANVTVNAASQPVFADTAAITLSASGAASPNPSTNFVSNVSGLIGKITVSLIGLQNVTPANLTVVLTSPRGQSVTLLANNGPAGPVDYGQITFGDGGAASPPSASTNANTVVDPAQPLSSLIGVNPNGTWSLFVTNGGAGGKIAGGWVLNIFAAPTVVTSTNSYFMQEETTLTIPFTVSDINGTVTNVTTVVPAGSPATAQATLNNDNATGSVLLTGQPLKYGTNSVQIIAKDNNGFFGTNTFQLGVIFVDHAPQISFLDKQITRAGVPLGPVSFTVDDPDLPAQNLTVTAHSDNQKLLPDGNIIIGTPGSPVSGSTWSFTLFPIGTVSGTNNVSIIATDGTLSTTNSFIFFVQEPANPLYASSGVINIAAGQPAGGTAPASPYPSTIGVSNLFGVVEDVQVTLFDVIDPIPSNASVLLVGAGGQKVLLMQNAGGTNANGTTLVFSDAASGALPQTGQILSGIYKPSGLGTATSLVSPAPGLPYSSAFSAFKGLNPNTNWSLYVEDTGSIKGGLIQGGWLLSIRTAPNVQPVPDQTTAENTSKRVSVTVGDNEPGVTIDVTATTTNTSLIQSTIAVSGTGGTRILTVNPVPYQVGTGFITVKADDGINPPSFTTFKLTVTPAILQPVIAPSPLPDTSTPAGTETSPIAFTIWDPQANGTGITVTPSSSNQALVPNGNITVTPPASPTATGTNSWSVSVLPAGVQTGTTTISLLVDDGSTNITTSFKVTVTSTVAFANTNAIAIPEGLPVQGSATPYPSINTVSGVHGLVKGVRVSLIGFSHQFPSDVDVLLVSPDNSKSVVLMAHAGDSTAANDLRLTFSDTAGSAVPQNAALTSGSFQPANYAGTSIAFPSPAPVGPYSTSPTLSTFNDISPNGDWKLYVLDDNFPDNGSISGGWIIFLQTSPEIAAVPPQTTPENTTLTVPLALSDSLVDASNLVASASHSGDYPANLISSITVTNQGANPTLVITPVPNIPSSITNANGTNLIQVTVLDTVNGYTATTSFPLTVQVINVTPSASPVLATNIASIDENSFTNLTYNISDPDSVLNISNVTVTSSNPAVVGNSTNNIVVTGTVTPTSGARGSTGSVTVKVTPNANQFGTNTTLAFAISDGNSSYTTNITLAIRHIYQGPTISGLSNTNFVAGSPTPTLSFTVGSVEVSSKNLTVTASSSDQTIVKDTGIVLGGGGDTRTIQFNPVGANTGPTTIKVNVGDGVVTNFTTFVLTLTAPPPTLFANPQSITITGNATNANSLPYPSAISVSGLNGNAFKVDVVLQGLTANSPSNVDILVVGPNGTSSAMLMSGAGGVAPVSNLRLVFDDSETPVPTDSLTSGTNHPVNFTSHVLPGPAPAGPYIARLSTFAGINPNGTWNLFVNDKVLGDTGSIAGGWQLIITPVPTISVTTPTPVVFNESGTATVNFTIADQTTSVTNLTVTSSSDNATLMPSGSVALTSPIPANGALQATLTPAPFQSGTNNLTLTVTRSDGANASVVVPMSVTPVNFKPTISRLDTLITAENTGTNVSFLVSDPDTSLKNLTVTATSSDQGIIGNTNLVFVGSTNNTLHGLPPVNGLPQTSQLQLNLQPNSLQIGSSTISITVIDPEAGVGTNTVVSNFVFQVQSVYFAPTITVPNQAVFVTSGSSTSFGIKVGSQNTPPPTLTVSGTSDAQSLVKNADIHVAPASGPAGDRVVTITAQPGVTNQTPLTLTLSVNDGTSTVKATVTVNVRPNRQHVFANKGAITINAVGPSTPYPSSNVVSGLSGYITNVSVTVRGFAHSFPSDVGMMLVGPTGQAVVLMNHAGDGVSVTNLDLTFSADLSNPVVPSGSALATATYRPANYNSSFTFPAPAPGGPYSTDLTKFYGTSGNGAWLLYVEDDTPSDSGVITGGWSLNITTQPAIVGLHDITVNENTTVRESFTIDDDSPAPPSYTAQSFAGTSSDQNVVTNGGIAFSGSGTNWSVTVTPVPFTVGTNITITVFGTNGDNQTLVSSFKATFIQVPIPPTIQTIPDTQIEAGSVARIPLNYSGPGIPQNQLAVSFKSDTQNVIPDSNLILVGTNLQVTTVGAVTGSANITVTVKEPISAGGLSTNTTFNLTVVPPSVPVFANTNAIVINDDSPASPYPSRIVVGNVNGKIIKATATMVGFQHGFPSDVSLLLVGPQGQTAVLMSRAGDGVAVSDLRLTFDDSAAGAAPQSALSSGTFLPSDYKTTDLFPGAPSGPYGHTLSAFNGTNPNGTWSLYVEDDVFTDSGNITGGWLLSIQTDAAVFKFISPQTTLENVPTNISFTVTSGVTNATNLVVTAATTSSSPPGLIASLVASKVSTNGTGTVTITPAPNMPSSVTNSDGIATITLAVTDGKTTNFINFPLTVIYVNQPPTLAGLADTNTPANQVKVVHFTANDVDTAASGLTLSATSSDTSVGNVSLTSSGNNQTLTFIPAGTGKTGQTTIAVSVSDGTTSISNGFVVTVTSALPPVIAPIPDTNSVANIEAVVPITVTDPVTSVSNLVFTGTSGNPSVASKVTFTVTGSGVVASIVPAKNATGQAVITITASDGITNASQSFTLTVVAPPPPVLGQIADTTTKANVPVTVPVPVTSAVTPVSNLVFSAVWSNTNLVSGISIANNGTAVTASVALVANATGTSVITISANDGFTVASTNFNLTVTPPAKPVLGAIADVSTTAGKNPVIQLSVTSPDTAITNLTFSGASTNASLVSSVTFALNGNTEEATVHLVANATGNDFVTITVSDAFGQSSSASFNLHVTGAAVGPTLTISVSGKQVTLKFKGSANTALIIQASSDLKAWTNIGNVTTDANGNAQQTVTESGAHQFYRAQVQ